MSLICVYSQQAIAEVRKKLNDRSFYVGGDGRMFFSVGTETVNYVLSSMTA